MILFELFDKPADVRPGTHTGPVRRGNFTVGPIEFEYTFIEHGSRKWTYAFEVTDASADAHGIDDVYGETGLSGQQALTVMSTAVAVLERFIRAEKPLEVFFSGDESHGWQKANGVGKGKLYGLMAKKLAPKLQALGYTIKVEHNTLETSFTIIPNSPALKPKITRA